ncbi:hypothetical protein E5D57_005693 [Metarhizium anisopliae]|nr:hypothetical protein E5D57_005693 [Metarhizium anisopliae]
MLFAVGKDPSWIEWRALEALTQVGLPRLYNPKRETYVEFMFPLSRKGGKVHYTRPVWAGLTAVSGLEASRGHDGSTLFGVAEAKTPGTLSRK